MVKGQQWGSKMVKGVLYLLRFVAGFSEDVGVWDIHSHTAREGEHRNREVTKSVEAVMGREREESPLTIDAAVEAKAENYLSAFFILRDKIPTWTCLGKKGNLLANTGRKIKYMVGRTRSKNWTQPEINVFVLYTCFPLSVCFILSYCQQVLSMHGKGHGHLHLQH